MNELNKEEIEFITQCLKGGKLLPDSYRYIIPSRTKKELINEEIAIDKHRGHRDKRE